MSRIEKIEFKPDTKAVAAELKNGVPIADADLRFGEFRRVIGWPREL